jgi:hypothetical protein
MDTEQRNLENFDKTHQTTAGTGRTYHWTIRKDWFESEETEIAFTEIANKYPHFVELHFRRSPRARLLSNITTRCLYVSNLWFCDITANPAVFDPFFASLATNTIITRFTLHRVVMQGSSEEALGTALESNTSITNLVIDDCTCEPGFYHVIRAVGVNDTMTSLTLRSINGKCKLRDGMEQVFITNTRLAHLDLSSNYGGNDFLRHLCRIVAQNSTLQTLKLSNSLLCWSPSSEVDRLVRDFARALATNKSLLSIDLSNWGPYFNIEPILEVLPETNLRSVFLAENPYPPRVYVLCEAIEACSSLKELSLDEETKYSETELKWINGAVRLNPRLTHMSIVSYINEHLKRNRTNELRRGMTLAEKSYWKYHAHIKRRFRN